MIFTHCHTSETTRVLNHPHLMPTFAAVSLILHERRWLHTISDKASYNMRAISD